MVGSEARGRVTVPARFGLAEDSKYRIKWGTPRLVFGVSDPQGIRSLSALELAGEEHAFEPGSGDAANLPGGVHVPLPGLRAAGTQPQTVAFALNIELAGYGRHALRLAAPLLHHELAVSFIEPAGLYQQLERASKYGFLFIGLTLAAFILVELLRRLRLDPVQYALVGLALAMFFLLLIALSEHVDFTLAYAIATAACVGLISGYLVRVLRSALLGLSFGASLTALYAMLYALLKAEDYSLLGGRYCSSACSRS